MPARDALAKQIQRFLDHLAVERGLSGHTVEAYRRDLERYATFLRTRGVTDARRVDERAVAAHVAAVSASTSTVSTVRISWIDVFTGRGRGTDRRCGRTRVIFMAGHHAIKSPKFTRPRIDTPPPLSYTGRAFHDDEGGQRVGNVTAAHLLVRTLKRHGVDRLFGLCGDHVNSIFNSNAYRYTPANTNSDYHAYRCF